MAAKDLIVVGPNPALQKTLSFDTLSLGEVNRATLCREYTGGKGTNFCRASGCLGGSPQYCRTHLYTFLGGRTGDRVLALFHEEGFTVHPIRVAGETRTCTTCLDTGRGTMTELIEPSFAVADDAATEMDNAVRRHLQSAAGLAIMGSLPDNTNPQLYTRWARIAAETRKPLLVDAVKGVEEALTVAGAETVLKVNMEELRKLTGKGSAVEAFAFAFDKWAIRILAVTDGPSVAHMQVRGDDVRREFHIAPLDGVVNPLGAGDTADAVLFAMLLHGVDPYEAFRLALAAASANCLQQDSGVFTLDDMKRIAATITVVKT